MTIFTRTWDAAYEAQPAQTENINLGATRIRNLKEDIQERIVVDHSFAGDANDGKHTKVTLMPAVGSPTLDVGDGAFYAVDDTTNTDAYWKDALGNDVRLTRDGAPNNVFPADISVSGNATLGSLVVVGVAQFENDPNIEISLSGGVVFFKADSNSYMSYNRSNGLWQFYTNGVLVGQFPP